MNELTYAGLLVRALAIGAFVLLALALVAGGLLGRLEE
jgi:hypothetical protein